MLELQGFVRFDRDARVFLRRPHADVDKLGAARDLPGSKREEKRSAGGGYQAAAVEFHDSEIEARISRGATAP